MQDDKVVGNDVVAAKEVTVEDKVDFSDLFVTEKDTFDISVSYYKDNNKIMVQSVDEDFDTTRKNKEFTITFKYPSQSDYTKISMALNKESDINMKDILMLEYARILVLARSWTLKQKIDNDTLSSLNSKIVKAIVIKMREKIGMEAII